MPGLMHQCPVQRSSAFGQMSRRKHRQPCRHHCRAKPAAAGSQLEQQSQPAFEGYIQPSSDAHRPLDVSRNLAWARCQESQQAQPLFIDNFAACLANTSPQCGYECPRQLAMDVTATHYMDDCLMNTLASTSTNSINAGDYRQVVLLGDGMDTRPFRLPLPTGAIVFLVAPSESHELAEAVLRQRGDAHVPRGCLLRRVNADLQGGGSFRDALERAGFQGDRVSVWVLQGLPALNLSASALASVLDDVTGCAAFHSLVIGELPAMGRADAANLLAEFGLLGTVRSFGEEDIAYGRWRQEWQPPPPVTASVDCSGSMSSSISSSLSSVCDSGSMDFVAASAAAEFAGSGSGGSASPYNQATPLQQSDSQQQHERGWDTGGGGGRGTEDLLCVPVKPPRWLFAAQQMRLSLVQMGVYADHVEAAEGTDEDLFTNFS